MQRALIADRPNRAMQDAEAVRAPVVRANPQPNYLDISDAALAALFAFTLKLSTNGEFIFAGAAGILATRFVSNHSVLLPKPASIMATIALIAPGLLWFGSGTHAVLTAAAFTAMALTRLKVANPAN